MGGGQCYSIVYWLYPTILITQVPVFQQNVELSNAIFSQGVSQHDISQRVFFKLVSSVVTIDYALPRAWPVDVKL